MATLGTGGTFARLCGTVALLLTVSWSGAVFADRVELKTGEVFFGKILRADDREVSVRLQSGGIISFRMSQVSYFRKNYVVPDEWIPSPVLEIESDSGSTDELGALMSFQGPGSVTPTIQQASSSAVISSRADPLDPTLVHDPFTDSSNGFQLAVPRGFLTWQRTGDSSVGHYYDPVTQATLNILALGPSEESLEIVKRETARAYERQVSELKVVRDQPIGGAPFEGWLFEVKSQFAGVAVHQLQLFARSDSKVIVLTYSSSEKHFANYRRSFAESIRSFQFTAATDAMATDDTQENNVIDVKGSPDLLRLLPDGWSYDG